MDVSIENMIKTMVTFWFNMITKFLISSGDMFNKLIQDYRRKMSRIMLHYLIMTTEANTSLNVGPLLRFMNPRKRKIWMKMRSSDWWERIVWNNFDELEWIENFRMKKETFMWLCDQLRPSLAPHPDFVISRPPVSVEKQVAIALYFLASCCEYRIVGNAFGVHKSTVCKVVHNVVFAIKAILSMSYLSMPAPIECRNISFHFENRSGIPQLIGAIDGSHIPILPPSDGYRDFINRKQWPSIVLQAVVDHAYRFRNINCQSPGSAHDSSVLRGSSIYNNCDDLIPKDLKNIDGVDIPYMIVGDPAYPLLPWLVKGYIKSARLTPEEESFNVYLNSARVVVEIAFGRLKARWRSLLKRLDVHYTFAPHIVAACCILHNIVEENNEQFLSNWKKAVEEAELEFPQPQKQATNMLPNFNASHIRDTLKDYLAANFEMRRSFHVT